MTDALRQKIREINKQLRQETHDREGLRRDGIDPDRGFEPLKKVERWKNLSFDNAGKSYLHINVHPSKEIAKSVFDEVWARPGAWMRTLDGRLYVINYSHTIQLPIP